MGFWDLFKIEEEKQSINKLYGQLQEKYPNDDEKSLILIACSAGLMARVAAVNFETNESEKSFMSGALVKWCKLSQDKSDFIVDLAINEMKNYQGLDTRDYCTPLVENFSVDTRYQILEVLFQVAASDGNVDQVESNEINFISKSLLLEHKHFVSAKAQVKDYLSSLK